MRCLRPGIIGILTIVIGNPAALAADSSSTADRAAVFLQDRAHDAQQLIEGPQPPSPAVVPADLSCAQLYARRIELTRQTYDYKPPYWDDPRNRAAVFIGTIFTPAFYFLGYTGITEYLDTARGGRNDINVELDALRQVSAYKQCFVN